MGILVAYSELLLPKLFLQIGLSLGFLRQIIAWTFDAIGLGDLLDSDDHWPDPPAQRQPPSADCQLWQGLHPISAMPIQEVLPVVRFENLLSKLGESDNRLLVADGCAICLYEFEPHEDVRCLKNCRHIFHRCCLDRWLEHNQRACPLCRTPLISEEMREALKLQLWAAPDDCEFYDSDLSFLSSFTIPPYSQLVE